MPRKSSRRDFLFGKSAADLAADAADAALGEDEPMGPVPEAAAASYLIHISRRAMACEFEVFFNAGQYENDTRAALAALDLVDALEDQMTVFRQTSELCHVNRTAADGPVPVEPGLFRLLELAQRLHRQTDGALDITSSPLWRVWGFARREGRIPNEDELAAAMQCVGGHLVELDAEAETVRFLEPGVELNLGSLGKGYALDRAGDQLRAAGIGDFLFHGGQSSVLGRGSRMLAAAPADSAPNAPTGWLVGVRHPMRRGVRLAEIRLRDRSLATSSSAKQFFRHQGRRYGHILDPRTGRPAEGVLAATAVAPTAVEADALSTAFYVMGLERTITYCEDRAELGALLVCPAQRGPGFEIHSIGLEDDELAVTAEW